MLGGTQKNWLIGLTAARVGELRTMLAAATVLYRADHPQTIELQRQARIAEQALEQLRGETEQVAA